jgi:hypothetical protein
VQRVDLLIFFYRDRTPFLSSAFARDYNIRVNTIATHAVS